MSSAFKLRNGTILLSTEAPGGIYNAAQLKKIASLGEGDSVIIRATEDQRLALCVKPELAASIAEQLKSVGLGIRHYQNGLHQPTSCIGELCADHEQDALGASLDVSQVVSEINLTSPLKIGINGCAKCCVPCHTLDISVVGDMSGYRISLGGKNSQIPEMASFIAEGVPPAELPGLLKTVIELYKGHAEPDESLQSVIERVGSGEFIQALFPYSQDAAAGNDPFPGSTQANQEANSDEDTSADELGLELAPEVEPIALDSESPVTTEGLEASEPTPQDDFLDIDPSDHQANEDLSGEVAISSGEMEIPDIALNSDFEEDHLIKTSPATDEHPDLLEASIDVSDVLRTPSTVDAPNDTQEATQASNELTDVVSEEDESAYEQQLTASIAAQEKLIEGTEDETQRDEALGLLGNAEASLDDEVTSSELLESEANFDDLSDDHGTSFTKVQFAEIEDEFEQVETDGGSLHTLPLSELVSSHKKIQEHETDEQHVSESLEAHEVAPSSAWTISGFDIDHLGCPVIQFANGVANHYYPRAYSNWIDPHGWASAKGF